MISNLINWTRPGTQVLSSHDSASPVLRHWLRDVVLRSWAVISSIITLLTLPMSDFPRLINWHGTLVEKFGLWSFSSTNACDESKHWNFPRSFSLAAIAAASLLMFHCTDCRLSIFSCNTWFNYQTFLFPHWLIVVACLISRNYGGAKLAYFTFETNIRCCWASQSCSDRVDVPQFYTFW